MSGDDRMKSAVDLHGMANEAERVMRALAG
jgi:hypothetical protein